MKNKFYAIIFILIGFSFNAFAGGFKMDMPAADVAREFNIPNIASLAVAEKGLVSVHQLKMCLDGDILKIASISELESSPSEYLYAFEVTRNPSDTVSIAFSHKGKTPSQEAVKLAAMLALTSSDCDVVKKRIGSLFTVTEFLGAKLMSDLVSNTDLAATSTNESAKPFKSSNQGAIDRTDWIVSESKSPIDDSPTVSLLKNASQSDQLLLLRCQENKTDAIIVTDDFLGMDSTNVTIRYDSNDAEKQRFKIATNNKVLFFQSPISHIKRMMDSDKLTIRYQAYSDGHKTAVFDLTGIHNNIDKLRAACHW